MISVFFVLLEIILLFFISSFLKKSFLILFYTLFRRDSVVISLFSLLFYPGVVVHELSHFISAAILFVPIKDLILVPKLIDGKLRGGSVVIARVDFLRRTIVGIAPLFGGIGVMWVIREIGVTWMQNTEYGILYTFLSYYLLFSISATMYSSQKDLEALLYTIPFLLVMAGILYIVGFQFIWVIESLDRFEGILREIKDILIVPLIINGSLLLVLSVVSGGRLWGRGRP